jgi:lysophospholipase L1-like esterase
MLLSLFVLGLGCAAMAQTMPTPGQSVSTTGAAPVATAQPPDPTSPDNALYIAKPNLLTDCQQRLAAVNDKPCDVIFIGDTLTQNWLTTGKSIWDAKYVPMHALNFGVAGDGTQNVLWRLDNMDIQSLKPKVAVLLIGTNNYESSVHQIADGVKAVLSHVQASFPGVKVILISILPNDRATDKTTQVNSLIKNLDDGTSTFYLDLASQMTETTSTGADGSANVNWKGIGKDHLLLDAEGYQIWADAMDPLLKKLMGVQ